MSDRTENNMNVNNSSDIQKFMLLINCSEPIEKIWENRDKYPQWFYENTFANDSKYAYLYARDVIKKRWEKCEHSIIKSAEYTYLYAKDVIKKHGNNNKFLGDSNFIISNNTAIWFKEEFAIAKSAEYAYLYARDVINERYKCGEAAIAENPKYAYFYVKDVIKKRWLEGEAAIAKSAEYAYLYARDVIKRRFGEDAIAKDSMFCLKYAELLFPNVPENIMNALNKFAERSVKLKKFVVNSIEIEAESEEEARKIAASRLVVTSV